MKKINMKLKTTALLRTSLSKIFYSQATFTLSVLPACLPTDPNKDFVGEKVTVAGWGYTGIGKREGWRGMEGERKRGGRERDGGR